MSRVAILFPPLEGKISCKQTVHQVVQVVALDEPLPLVARVHGHPAQLVLGRLPLHEVPDWLTHHRHRLQVGTGQLQETTGLVHLHTISEELA